MSEYSDFSKRKKLFDNDWSVLCSINSGEIKFELIIMIPYKTIATKLHVRIVRDAFDDVFRTVQIHQSDSHAQVITNVFLSLSN